MGRDRGEVTRPGARRHTPHDAPLGGQAVLEGVMMRGVRTWAVAVRTPMRDGGDVAGGGADGRGSGLGEIAVTTRPIPDGERVDGTRRRTRGLCRLPLVRGVVALWGSLSIGMRALAISANAQLPAGTRELSGPTWAGATAVSIAFAVGLFFVVPVGATSLVRAQLGSSWLFWLVEGCLRTAIFLGYLVLVSRLRDLRRLLEYHGAEHKVISCYEAGDALTPESAARHSRLHPRCGTSFLLIVMMISIVVFAPIGLPAWWILVLTRIAGVPVIAGLAYEVIRWAGRHRDRRWVRALLWPGMRLQLLTTREPDLDELAVSIASLEAVLARETPGADDAEALSGVEVLA